MSQDGKGVGCKGQGSGREGTGERSNRGGRVKWRAKKGGEGFRGRERMKGKRSGNRGWVQQEA